MEWQVVHEQGKADTWKIISNRVFYNFYGFQVIKLLHKILDILNTDFITVCDVI